MSFFMHREVAQVILAVRHIMEKALLLNLKHKTHKTTSSLLAISFYIETPCNSNLEPMLLLLVLLTGTLIVSFY